MKTAVEWLKNKILNENDLEILVVNIDNWIEQAKQMEKEQIMKAAEYMYIKCKGGDGMPKVALKDLVEKYYNETYTK